MDRRPTYEELEHRVNSLEQEALEHERVIEAQNEGKQFSKSLLDYIPNPFLVINTDTSIEYVNPALTELTGFSEKRLLGLKAPYPWWTEETFHKTRKDFGKVIHQGARQVEEVFKKKTGELFWVEISSEPVFLNDEFRQHLVSWIDVTKRKKAEEALQKNGEKYLSLVESTGDSIYLIGEDLTYLFMNQSHLLRYGKEAGEIIGRNYAEFHSENETRDFANKIKAVFDTGRLLSYDYESERDGEYYLRSLNPVKGPDGKISAVTIISRSITERKKAEEELKKSKKKLQYLSSQLIKAQEEERKRISLELHDEMGQSLTAIGLTIDQIEEALPSDLDPKIGNRLADIKSIALKSVDQLSELCLALRPSMLDDIGLIPTLRWHISKEGRRAELEIKLEIIDMDERLGQEIETVIFRIFQEALNNIIKHADAKQVILRIERKQGSITFSIKDDGKGFDIHKALTDQQDGSIGLIGMQERANIIGGNLRITSRKGHGTRILVEIPEEIDDGGLEWKR